MNSNVEIRKEEFKKKNSKISFSCRAENKNHLVFFCVSLKNSLKNSASVYGTVAVLFSLKPNPNLKWSQFDLTFEGSVFSGVSQTVFKQRCE